jgi:hypothetical protein
MPNSPGYIWEKMYVAISCMCGKSSLEQRISDATISALMRLNENDLDGELGEDLKYVLKWTKNNIYSGETMKVPDDLEHKKLVEKMMHIMLETHDAL